MESSKTPFCALFANLRPNKNFSGKSSSFIFLYLDCYCCAEFNTKLTKKL